ncbi:putative oxidoreductase, mmyf [Rhodococcus wratislaviensis]|uniref:Putative oxidoreductase, mmyf n=1 Tax=Rhodococcus wratislaviensis TaxID=44752 RepID=A0A402CH80_RHOWR|nr:flavin reductase [Rhodococcus wratislaviensis]GCE42962.1 putative oxidoreductase, mmyf [Rhodococcus wratislaviensis]
MSQVLSQKTTTSQKQFRAAMRRLPTSVVVSAVLDDAPIGMVVGTFSSVSMDPLLVGFFGDHRSSTLEPLLETDQWSFSDRQDQPRPGLVGTRGIVMRSLAVPYAMSPVPSARR